MAEKEIIKKKRTVSFAFKVVLLMSQIMLPFAMFFALRWEWNLGVAIIAAIFFISMLLLVGVG